MDLWPSQLAAASRASNPHDDLVIALPTSAGKTRIAELCILRAIADEKRIVYVTPLRALSAQIERVLRRTFTPLGVTVTSLYGASGATFVDMQTLEDADIVVSTPEKLDFAIRQDPQVLDDVALVVFDEGHMIGLGSREIRYEVLIQRLLRRADADQRRIVCLSAMFNADDPYFLDFSNWLRSDEPGDPIHVKWRPTRQRLATLDWNERTRAARLKFIEDEEAFVPRFLEGKPAQKLRKNDFPANEIEFCISAANGFARDGQSVLVYSPQRSQVEPVVREFHHMFRQGYLTDVPAPEAKYLAVAMAIGREWLGEKHEAVLGLSIGVGMHHGALPRPFLAAVEELLNARRLPIVVASPTLAQGVDLSCGVLIFRSLERFNPETKKRTAILPAEFANVVGRAGRAYVDLDGITVLPSFESGWPRTRQHGLFRKLVDESRGQRLVSGLARLVMEVAREVERRLGVPPGDFTEYVTNQRDLWQDSRLLSDDLVEEDDNAFPSLGEHVADLDVALLSLIEPLDSPDTDLPTLLDEILRSSLWKRTLAHFPDPVTTLEREILVSRAQWVWRTTTDTERRACFFSGLGRDPGLFLFKQLDALIDVLVDFHSAVSRDNADAAGQAAVAFAELVIVHPFFSVNRLPQDWQQVLHSWITGVPFSDILNGRKTREAQRTQGFVQDGVVFRLVWAAEAVRFQAITANHPRAMELGDGPAFALTYGVSSVPAALLCQVGFASRVGAISVTRRLEASFTDIGQMSDWVRSNDAFLSRPDFWDSEDQYTLWRHTAPPSSAEFPRAWKRVEYFVSPVWSNEIPIAGTRVRLIPRADRSAVLCASDLAPLGRVDLAFDPRGVALDAVVVADDRVSISYFGGE
jgi:hypothetical protein